jgi:hypothetical protein
MEIPSCFHPAANAVLYLLSVNRNGQIGQIQGSTGPICAKGGFFSGHLARLSIDRYLQQFI